MIEPTQTSKPRTLPILKLPRQVEADPRHEALKQLLAKDLRPLWEKSPFQVAHISFTPKLEEALLKALNFKQIEPGLEHINQILGNEKNGLSAQQKKDGAAPSFRLSRLLIIANDGSERFYRSCESTLMNHGDRVLILAVGVPSSRLSQNLYGPEKAIKALMVSEREAVSNVLFSLI